MPRGGPNLGKNARVIFAMLSYASPLFVQRAYSPAEPKGAHGPIGGRGFPRHNPSPSSKPTMELLTPGGEHHEIW
jgi:hypothetical protein